MCTHRRETRRYRQIRHVRPLHHRNHCVQRILVEHIFQPLPARQRFDLSRDLLMLFRAVLRRAAHSRSDLGIARFSGPSQYLRTQQLVAQDLGTAYLNLSMRNAESQKIRETVGYGVNREESWGML